MEETCYMCNSEATSREHVPARCFFGDLELSDGLLTVPSCRKHNTEKSKSDEYLRFILVATGDRAPDFATAPAIRGHVRLMKERKCDSISRLGIVRGPDGGYSINPSPEVDRELLQQSLDYLSRALYFHERRKKLLGKSQVHPYFLGIDESAELEVATTIRSHFAMTVADLKELPTKVTHGDILEYQIVEDQEIVVVNMVFYGSSVASVWHSLHTQLQL